MQLPWTPRGFTLVEYMPFHLRCSRDVATALDGYPMNGAARVYVMGHVDPEDVDPLWARVIEDGISELPVGEAALEELPAEALRPLDA